MKSELNNIGKEFLNSEEIYQSVNQESIVPMEFSMPVGEFTECAPEFIDMVQSVEDKPEESIQKNKERKKKNAREKLVKKMSYMVVSAVTTLTLAGTLNLSGIIQENVLSAGGSVE
ncbi:MAG: hypothetical protein IJ274_14985, partial [Lachnospiraceae bacterium]|nr:hypothetical protein [Lachnospiraceae bacterium]